MKRLLTLVAFFATLQASAQQVNPVPDYVFRNQMSVGRNAVTDTAAYFSIGPRYGANKGFMPPIVGDTATFSSGKRNGLLIFSVQKNKFLYWDSVRVQWSDMAGSSGSYIVAGDTASMLTPYVRQAGYGLTKSGQSFLVDTLNIATRAWRQKGDDSVRSIAVLLNGNQSVNGNKTFLADITFDATTYHRVMSVKNITNPAYNHVLYSKANQVNQFLYYPADTGTLITDKTLQSFVSGTTNYIPKFTAGSTIGNSQIFDNGTRVGIGTASPAAKVDIRGSGLQDLYFISSTVTNVENTIQSYFNSGGAWADLSTKSQNLIFNTGPSGGPQAERLRITSGGNVGIGDASPTDLLVVNGRMRVNGTNRITFGNNSGGYAGIGVTGATTGNLTFNTFDGTSDGERLRIFANGRIGINTTTDAGYQLDVNGTARINNALQVNKSDGGQAINIVGNSNTASIQQNGSDMYFNSNTNTTGGGFFFRNSSSFTTRMAIDASGNVGIGTASPANKLSINGAANALTYFLVDNSQTYLGDNGVIGGGAADGNTALSWFSSKDLYIKEGSSTRMTIKSGGNVGVNTASPAQKLDVSGNMQITGGGNWLRYDAYGYFGSGSVAGGTTTDVAVRSENSIYFSTGGATEKMRLSTTGELIIGGASDLGDYKLQVAGNIYGSGLAVIGNAIINTNSPFVTGANIYTNGQSLALGTHGANLMSFFTNNAERGRINSAGEWIIDASGTDAGDYKLQVVGNARVGTGKLDIVTNTAFGLSVSRSGTDVVAQQINNSTGILYYGAESSTGGALFTGSSAYAAVIGSGAAYPLQFATDNVTRATINTNGELLINTLTDNGDFKLQVNGSALISGSIQTANPVSGTAVPWRLGSVVATNVQLDTGNYVEVNINGTFYRLAIVTPL